MDGYFREVKEGRFFGTLLLLLFLVCKISERIWDGYVGWIEGDDAMRCDVMGVL